ncbi:MAG: hypothetical protein AB7U76_25855, partial [Pirellulales bacterium]
NPTHERAEIEAILLEQRSLGRELLLYGMPNLATFPDEPRNVTAIWIRGMAGNRIARVEAAFAGGEMTWAEFAAIELRLLERVVATFDRLAQANLNASR